MKAIVQNDYGLSNVLKLDKVPKPTINDTEVLIQVHATSINAGDYFSMKGEPYLARFSVGFPKPKNFILGWDVAGIVEAVGSKIKRLKKGDKVYGAGMHTFAEYVTADEDLLALIPTNLSFEQAAAIPTAGLTALQQLRDHGGLKKGQKILINGASGGVGHFAVQVAKAMGAEVTAVCSSKNADMVRSIGADHVIDYAKEDFTKGKQRYDLVLDNMGNRKFSDMRRALTDGGKIQPNTGHGGMKYVIKSFLLAPFLRTQGTMKITEPDHQDLAVLNTYITAGKVIPVIDRTYSLEEIPKAMSYAERGHVSGKVVISVRA